MKDASSCKISLKGLSIAVGQVQGHKIDETTVMAGKPFKEIRIYRKLDSRIYSLHLLPTTEQKRSKDLVKNPKQIKEEQKESSR